LRSPLPILLLLILLQFPTAWHSAAATTGRVTWVYDGDTIEVAELGRVRLLGIDVPESAASERDRFYQRQFRIAAPILRSVARQAKEFVIAAAHGRTVRLEFDRQRTDAYGRLLAYVYLPDGALLNLVLLDKGLATVFRRADFVRKEQFFAAEKTARDRRIGIWQKQPMTVALPLRSACVRQSGS
jgi:micrococcal nuclease